MAGYRITDDTKAIDRKLGGLGQQVTRMGSRVDDVGGEVTDLRRSVERLNGVVASLRCQVETLKGRQIPDQILEEVGYDRATDSRNHR